MPGIPMRTLLWSVVCALWTSPIPAYTFKMDTYDKADVVSAAPKVYHLTVNRLTNPLGLDDVHPQLSWKLTAGPIGLRQTAYRIRVSTVFPQDSTHVIWDTGRIPSDQSVGVPYQGPPLQARQRYYWTVDVWTNQDTTAWVSQPAHWEMGLLTAADWQGTWLSEVGDTATAPRPAPLFRKTFTAHAAIQQARLYITGAGYYEAYLNGERIGNHVLDPAFTRYDKRILYVTYDVTQLLTTGINALGVILGNGWYNQHTRSAWDFDKAPWRHAPTFRCQLEITFTNGQRQIISTDRSWRVAPGPILFNGIRNGAYYDSRKALPLWSTPGFNDATWAHAQPVTGPAGQLTAQSMPPIRVIKTLPAQTITARPGHRYLVDFGENTAGRIRLQVHGPPNQNITIRYGERLLPNGSLDQQELARFIWQGETQTDHYITNGQGLHTWAPTFTYYGFRYIEITGYPGILHNAHIQAEVLHTDLTNAGGFACANTLFNKLYEATRQSFLTNYQGYPTDCPHREKIGWSGDAQLSAEVGLYNFNLHAAYIKWLNDFTDEQQPGGQISGIIPSSGWGYTYGRDTAQAAYHRGYGPQWEAAFVSIPWHLFQYTADTTVIRRYYPALKKYQQYLTHHAQGHLLNFGIDDHKPVHTVTEGPILASGFYYYVTHTLAHMATVLNLEADAQALNTLAEAIQAAFHQKYFNPATHTYGNGGQTSLSEALYFGLVPAAEEAAVCQQLILSLQQNQHHLDAGVLGVKFITNVLMQQGYDTLLYSILNRVDAPSFGYWISQGATTLWQEWDGSRSLNHIMFGSFAEFFFKSLAGIRVDPAHPGFKQVILAPQCFESLDWVKAWHESPYGTIRSEWKHAEHHRVIYDCVIPPNSRGIIQLPVKEVTITAADGSPLLNPPSIRPASKGMGVMISVDAGAYRITFKE